MGSSQPRHPTCVSYVSGIGRQVLYTSSTWEACCLKYIALREKQAWTLYHADQANPSDVNTWNSFSREMGCLITERYLWGTWWQQGNAFLVYRGQRKMSSVQFSSVAQSCLTLCDPMDCSMAEFPVHHQLLELTQIHVHWVGDAMQPSHPLLSPSPVFNLSQHQGLFIWVSSSHQLTKVLEFQL